MIQEMFVEGKGLTYNLAQCFFHCKRISTLIMRAIIKGYIYAIAFLVFSACRDTQHHASDDKREGGLYVGAVERHHCDTVRRVWQSNPYQQVRTSPDTYEFVACAS